MDPGSIQQKSRKTEKINGSNYAPGPYREEAWKFLRQCLKESQYEELLTRPKVKKYPYVVAKVVLSLIDWERYVYIEQNGSLDGFDL